MSVFLYLFACEYLIQPPAHVPWPNLSRLTHFHLYSFAPWPPAEQRFLVRLQSLSNLHVTDSGDFDFHVVPHMPRLTHLTLFSPPYYISCAAPYTRLLSLSVCDVSMPQMWYLLATSFPALCQLSVTLLNPHCPSVLAPIASLPQLTSLRVTMSFSLGSWHEPQGVALSALLSCSDLRAKVSICFHDAPPPTPLPFLPAVEFSVERSAEDDR